MPRKKGLPYLKDYTNKQGKRVVYVRRPGKPLVRIHEKPGTDEFFIAYQAALAGQVAPALPKVTAGAKIAPDTLEGLCRAYYASADFKGLAPSTQQVRRLILDGLCRKIGACRHAHMRPQDVRKIRDDHADRPEAANGKVKALRMLFKWASDPTVGRAAGNPAKEVPFLRPKNRDGFHTWTLSEVEQYRNRWPLGTKQRLALDLLLFTGTRRSDAVRLGPQMERDGWLSFTEQKGRTRDPKHRDIPILQPLRESIAACPSGHLTYLATEQGAAYSPPGFGNWFRRQCDAAGLPDCAAHGLRKAGATFAAEAGATTHELMAIFGWTNIKQAEVYTRKAAAKRLAGGAMHKITGQTGNKIVSLNPEKRDTSAKTGEKSDG